MLGKQLSRKLLACRKEKTLPFDGRRFHLFQSHTDEKKSAENEHGCA
ncbi:hypothetical protein ACLBWT_07045 [Paenibacillus sp. D51F]